MLRKQEWNSWYWWAGILWPLVLLIFLKQTNQILSVIHESIMNGPPFQDIRKIKTMHNAEGKSENDSGLMNGKWYDIVVRFPARGLQEDIRVQLVRGTCELATLKTDYALITCVCIVTGASVAITSCPSDPSCNKQRTTLKIGLHTSKHLSLLGIYDNYEKVHVSSNWQNLILNLRINTLRTPGFAEKQKYLNNCGVQTFILEKITLLIF